MRNPLPDHLLEEWDWSKNLEPSHKDITSKTKVWWIGKDCKHSFFTATNSRVQGTGCGVCYGLQVSVGVNDLATVNPTLSAEWHPTKNLDVLPTSVTPKSSKKVWWLGKNCNHEWEATVSNRASGTSCPICSGRETLLGYNDLFTKVPEIEKLWDWERNVTIHPDYVTSGSSKKVHWKCESGHTWEAKVEDVSTKRSNCPGCGNRVSGSEIALREFVSEILKDKEVQQSVRILNMKNSNRLGEIDIYIPSMSIGIEFNGLFFHSEYFMKSKNYHKDKRVSSEELGIMLIQVWEDDWRDKTDIVKRMLAVKLGVSNEEKVYARNITLREISYQTSKNFLEFNHIQGSVRGSIYLGAFHKEELVAVTVLRRRSEFEYELSRYATSKKVVGGHSKMVAWFAKNTEILKLVTFADLSISDGSLYEKTKWKFVEEIQPDYAYMKVNKRYHKFNYRLKRFKEDPNLQYIEGMTERDLAKLNGLHRVWDSGKKKYEFDLTSLRS